MSLAVGLVLALLSTAALSCAVYLHQSAVARGLRDRAQWAGALHPGAELCAPLAGAGHLGRWRWAARRASSPWRRQPVPAGVGGCGRIRWRPAAAWAVAARGCRRCSFGGLGRAASVGAGLDASRRA